VLLNIESARAIPVPTTHTNQQQVLKKMQMVIKSPVRKRAVLGGIVKEQIAAIQDPDEVMRLMWQVTQDNAELFNELQDKLQVSFSKWTWAQVCKKFSIPEALPVWEPKKCRVPDEIINWMIDAYDMVKFTHGPIDTGKEIRRNLYIQMLVSRIARIFSGNLTIEDEGALQSMVSRGCVEFVLYVLKQAIVCVIEAKTDVIGDSKGQLFLKLHAASHMNSITGFNLPYLRGVVSTAWSWHFYQFSSTKRATAISAITEKAPSEEEEEQESKKRKREKEEEEKQESKKTKREREKEKGDEDEEDDTGDDELFWNRYSFEESHGDIGKSDDELKQVAAKLYWMFLQGWHDVQQEFVNVWTEEVQLRERAKKTHKNKELLAEAMIALPAAKNRCDNANAVLAAALAAQDNDAALAAMKLLTQTFNDVNFYPK